MSDRTAARIVEYMAGPQVVWEATRQPVSAELIAVLCNAEFREARETLGNQVVIR